MHRRSSLSTQSSTKIIRLFAFVWLIKAISFLRQKKRIDQLMEISLHHVSPLTQNEQQKMANYLKINNISLSLQSQCYWPPKSMQLASKVNVIGTEEQKALYHEGKTQAILPYTVISAEPMHRWCCSSYTTQNCPGATP